MYSKKIVFSAATVPAMIFMQQSADYQKRRRVEKEVEIERRMESFKKSPVDITPQNGGSFAWTGKD